MRNKILTIPNLLSFLRIGIIPVFVYFYLHTEYPPIYAVLVLVASGLTDMIDGFIARRFNQTSEFGKLLDPLADKLTQAAICFCVYLRIEHFRFFLWFFIIKEGMMLIGSAILLKRKVAPIAAMWFGKLATCVFYVVMVVIVAFPNLPNMILFIMFAILTGVMLLSLIKYFFVFLEKMKKTVK